MQFFEKKCREQGAMRCTNCLDNFVRNWFAFSYLMQSSQFSHVNCSMVILPTPNVFFSQYAIFNFYAKNYMAYVKERREYCLTTFILRKTVGKTQYCVISFHK
jgi:hypothetical protein